MYKVQKTVQLLCAFLFMTTAALLHGSSIAITNPANGSTVSGTPLVMNGTSTGTSGYRVQYILDSINRGTNITDGSGNWSLNLYNVPSGSHTLYVNLFTPNMSTLLATSSTFTFTVSNPITIQINTPQNGAELFFNPVTVAGMASLGNTQVDVLANASLVATTVTDSFGNWTTSFPLVPDGIYTLTAQLIVAAVPVATAAITVDATINEFGNVARVDKIYGNDGTGALNGPPFLTICAALAATVGHPGTVVWVFPGTYVETCPIVIPTGVSLQGLNNNTVIISKSVTVATDLITMGVNTDLANVTLSLTSTNQVQLRGIVFPSPTTATAFVDSVILTVDNSTAGAGTSNIYGIYSNGSGFPASDFMNVRSSIITVKSVGSGNKRGILLDTASNGLNVRDTNIAVTNNGTGLAIGAETAVLGAILSMQDVTVSGVNTGTITAAADISQTVGTIQIANTVLANSNANGYGFTTEITPTVLAWSAPGSIPLGTNYMQLGTGTPSATEQFVQCPQNLVVKTLSARMTSNSGTTGITDTFTLRKNGVNTPLAVSVISPAIYATDVADSVACISGDCLSMQVVSGSTGANNTTVVVELY